MPVVEAMACGVPCVVSSHPSLDEACGDAARCAPIPRDPDAIAAAIARALDERDELVARGLEHARTFTWLGQRPRASRGVGGCAMNVAVDVTPLAQTRAGTARYLRSLAAADRARRAASIAFGGYARGRLAATLWLDLAWYPHVLPHRARRRRPALPDVSRPGAHGDAARRDGPRRRGLPPSGGVPALDARPTAAFVVPRVLRAARRVLAVSEFTASELEAVLRVPREKIRVVPNAVDAVFTPDGPARRRRLRARGRARSSRARISRATIEAAARLGLELRVVGARGWGGVEARGGNVSWLGEVDDEELARQYRGALCVAYPSLYEGFGIPVLEAMACGAPVVTSAGGATEEVAGGAAVLVDPLDVGAIAAGIEEAIAAPRRAAPARPRARARLLVGRDGTAHRRRLSRGGGVSDPLVVIDADVLGRQRTGDETYVDGAAARAAGRRRRAALRRDHAPARPRAAGHRADRAAGADPGAAHGRPRAAAPAPAAPGARALRPLAAARAARAPPCSPCRISPSSATLADGPARDGDLPFRRAALGAARGARARDLAAHEGRPRRALRPGAGEDRRHAARTRPRVRPRRHARRLPAASSARSRSARTRCSRPTRRRRPDGRLVVVGPERDATPRGGAAHARRRRARLRAEGRARAALPGGGGAALSDAVRRLRAARRRGDGGRHAGHRDARRGRPGGRRRGGRVRRAGGVRRDRRARARRSRRRGRAPGSSARGAALVGARRRGATVAVYREVLA